MTELADKNKKANTNTDKKDVDKFVENCIEWISGQRSCTITLSNRTHINKLKKLYSDKKDEFKYFHENDDGSICAKIPLTWIKISPPRKMNREYTDEERMALRDRLQKARAKKGKA